MNSELARRIAFTLGALLLYRIASHIPLPGINSGVWAQFYQRSWSRRFSPDYFFRVELSCSQNTSAGLSLITVSSTFMQFSVVGSPARGWNLIRHLPGARVVTEGRALLKDGDRVEAKLETPLATGDHRGGAADEHGDLKLAAGGKP